MKRFAVSLIALVVMLLAASLCLAADFDAYVYWVPPNTKKTIYWQGVAGSTRYELQIYKMETAKTVLTATNILTPSYTINWKTPGHYYAFIRSCQNTTCGDWKNTLDPTIGEVNGVPRAWVLYVPYPN